MKPYGHNRKDLLACAYGCCTLKSGKNKNCRDQVDRQNRKSARQEGGNLISRWLDEMKTDADG